MAIDGYRQGGIKIMTVFFLTIAMVLILGPMINDMIIEKTTILQSLEIVVKRTVLSLVGEEVESNLNAQIALIQELPFIPFVKDEMIENNNRVIYQLFQTDSFSGYLAMYIARFFVQILAFAIALLTTKIAIKIVDGVFDIFSKLPVIGTLNHISGMLLGIGKGVIGLWICFLLLAIFVDTGIGSIIYRRISEEQLLYYLYENNWLIQYLASRITL